VVSVRAFRHSGNLYVGTVVLPGAWSSVDPLTVDTWLSYLWLFPLVLVVGGPLLEEIGWRGFALERLEQQFGPLGGTTILGLLWAAWHYTQYAMADWAAQNGGFTLQSAPLFPAQSGSQLNGLIGFGGAALIILLMRRGPARLRPAISATRKLDSDSKAGRRGA
jgi:CAAX protease family protein